MMYNTDAVSLRIFKKSKLWKDLMINTRAFFPSKVQHLQGMGATRCRELQHKRENKLDFFLSNQETWQYPISKFNYNWQIKSNVASLLYLLIDFFIPLYIHL